MPTVLRLATEERRVRDVISIVSDELQLSETERNEKIPSGTKNLISSRVEWALTYLVQAGLVKRPRRAHFIITDEGTKVLQSDIDNLDLTYLKSIPAFIDFLNRKGTRKVKGREESSISTSDDHLSPEELIGVAYEEIESELREQVLERILQNSPAFFEQLVVKLLAAMGYGSPDTLAEVMGKSGDGGIDGIIHQDKLGLDVVYIQAKRYALTNAVNRPEMQAFVGTLAGVSAHKGLFVTTSRFSPGVSEYLKTVNARVITIDGDRLVELMVENGVGVKVRKNFELHRIDEDLFLEE